MRSMTLKSADEREAENLRRFGKVKRAFAASLALLSMTACGSKVDEAAERFEFLESEGADDIDLCQAAGAVAMAAEEENDSEAYDRWSTRQSLHCLRAQNDGLL